VAKRNAGELIAGAIVLAVAAGFLGYAVANTGRSPVAGYTLHAAFDNISGISVGSPVRLAGVQVGSVTGARIDTQITTEGLLGGNSLSLTPGGSEKMIADGGQITITQSAANIEDLLGKFIYNVGDLSGNVQKMLNQDQKKQDPPK